MRTTVLAPPVLCWIPSSSSYIRNLSLICLVACCANARQLESSPVMVCSYFNSHLCSSKYLYTCGESSFIQASLSYPLQANEVLMPKMTKSYSCLLLQHRLLWQISVVPHQQK